MPSWECCRRSSPPQSERFTSLSSRNTIQMFTREPKKKQFEERKSLTKRTLFWVMRKKREEHDRLRAKSTDQSGDYKNESSNEGDDSSDAETLSRWQYVVNYYPEIQRLYTSLAKLSPALAFSYRITVLERKLSGTGAATKLAETMKSEYMTRYFGNNEGINDLSLD
jgi:hypothetical protein